LAPHLLEKFTITNNDFYGVAISWTTDAPYRETDTAIQAMQRHNITCVEMEAAALYALSEALQ